MAEIYPENHDFSWDVQYDMLVKLDANPNLMHITGDMNRPHLHLFARMLELHHYRPGTQANDDYSVLVTTYPGPKGLSWIILSVPLKDKETVHAVADAAGVRLVNAIPHAIGFGGEHPFPLRSERVYSVENKPGSDAYKLSERDRLQREDDAKILAMEADHNEWLDQQARFWEEGRWWYRAPLGRNDPVLQTAHEAMSRLDSNGREIIWYAVEPPRTAEQIMERQ